MEIWLVQRHVADPGTAMHDDIKSSYYVSEDDQIKQYFDPGWREVDVSGVIFRSRIFLLSELIEMLDSGKLRYIGDTPFRKWSKSQKSRAIESLLIGIPPASIIIDGSDDTWYMAEGVETLDALNAYRKGEFKLTDVNFRSANYAGREFAGLPLRLKSRFDNCKIIATIINPHTSELYRLWVYSMALIRNNLERRLWECNKAIAPDVYGKLCHLSKDAGACDEHLLWLAMLAVFCADQFTTAEFDDSSLLRDVRFDMLECLLLKYFDTVVLRISGASIGLVDWKRTLARIVNKSVGVFGAQEKKWSLKKETCFVIVAAIAEIQGVGMKKVESRFEKLWEKHKRSGRGYFYQNYAAITSLILKDLTKK